MIQKKNKYKKKSFKQKNRLAMKNKMRAIIKIMSKIKKTKQIE